MEKIEEVHRRLSRTLMGLNAEWEETRQVWRDTVATEFEREHWKPIDVNSQQLLRAISDLSEALQKAESVVDRWR